MNALPVRLTIDQAWEKWHGNKDPLAREWLVVHYASLVKFVAGRLAAGLPNCFFQAEDGIRDHSR